MNFVQKKSKNFLDSKFFLIILIFLVIFLFYIIVDLYQKMLISIENKEVAENNIIQLEKRKQQLSFDLENINSEKGKEKIFRENFGLAKTGEKVITILEDSNSSNEDDIKNNIFLRIKNIFLRN